jgi:hypothetical protein
MLATGKAKDRFEQQIHRRRIEDSNHGVQHRNQGKKPFADGTI